NSTLPKFPSLKYLCLKLVSCFVLQISCFTLLSSVARAQEPPPLDGRDGLNLLLENFRPRPLLKVAEHPLATAKFPVVDVHTHFRHKFHGSTEALDDWVKLMDRNR